MTTFSLSRAAFGIAALATIAAPAFAQSARYDPRDPRFNGELRLVGAGVPLLFPELRDTARGRGFVIPNFDANGDGRISRVEARDANRAFVRIAGPRRDRFDWATYDRRAPVVVETTTWNRRAMRDYGFRQTPRGAMLTLSEDVLFATDSSALRPGAVDKLRALADYLRANAGVRVAIDGYTDARGTAAHNRALSDHRADAVRVAFDDLGVTRARFSVEGHGETNPVASNATRAGMRQNRRVEVTLLGQRAESFARD